MIQVVQLIWVILTNYFTHCHYKKKNSYFLDDRILSLSSFFLICSSQEMHIVVII